MATCPICEQNEADKKNVHLIPWFMIKDCVTERGTGDRDMELSFTIDPLNFTKMYAGRSVLPEKIEEFGELNDLQKEKENPYTRDNLICHKCEENLSRIEAIFASHFTEAKIKSAYQAKLNVLNNHSVLVDSNYNFTLFELLIQSIFYRCSIGRFNGFSLNPVIEKKIQKNLSIAFSIPFFKKIKSSQEIAQHNIFPIITCRFFISEGEDPTKKNIVINQSRFPYFIMAGKWMFQLYETEKHLKNPVEWLYSLKSKLNALAAYKMIKQSSHVILLEAEAGKLISENLLHFFTEKRIIGLRKNIRELYLHIFKLKPNGFITQYIFQQYFIHLKQGKNEFDSMTHAFLDLKLLP